ncbi:hypothetical protein ACYOEI_17845, partial [Singulisphaera rosea]
MPAARSVSMPEKSQEPSPPVDVNAIHQLIRLMKRYDLTAIDLGEGPTKIRLRRRGAELAYAPAALPPVVMQAAPA